MGAYPLLYHLTLHRPDDVTSAIVCSFEPKVESLVIARGQWLEVLEIEQDQLVLRERVNVFATIRCMERVRTPGISHDWIIITSDSGKLVVLTYDLSSTSFTQVSAESIGLPGFGRSAPGEYLAVDPRGRAAIVAGIEKNRLVFSLYPEGLNEPVEASVHGVFCYELVALDKGYENPAFISLERYRFGGKVISLYEYDLGLNSVVKQWSREVSEEVCNVVALPGGREGPSGFIATDGTKVFYYGPEDGALIAEAEMPRQVVYATTVICGRNDFFAIVQITSGDCYSLTLDGTTFSSQLIGKLPYAQSLSVFGSGHMILIAADSGKCFLYQLTSINPLAIEVLEEEVQSMGLLTASTLYQKRLVVANGSKDKSQLSVVDFGTNLDELASTPLPEKPDTVFATRGKAADGYHKYILLAFTQTTTVLAVGDDGSVEEVSEAETGFAANVKTIGVHGLRSGMVQVHEQGLRHISKKLVPWVPPHGSEVVHCAFSPSQVVLGLNNNVIVYFEEREDGELAESKRIIRVPSIATAVTFAAPVQGEIRSSTIYVACGDATLRAYNTETLEPVQLRNLLSPASSIWIEDEYIYAGHTDGTLTVTKDEETYTRVLGSARVSLHPLSKGKLIALSSAVWEVSESGVSLVLGDRVRMTSACAFASQEVPNGVLAVAGSSLLVFTFKDDPQRLGIKLTSVPLRSATLRLARNTDTFYAAACDTIVPVNFEATSDLSPIEASFQLGDRIFDCVNVRFDSRKKAYLAAASASSISLLDYTGTGNNGDKRLTLLHVTPTEKCHLLLPFKGLLLAAISNNLLVLYDIGSKQLLRKLVFTVPDLTAIKSLKASRNLVFVGDSRRSVTVLNYDENGGFQVVATDPVSRAATLMTLLDDETVCIGDQYGNVTILRLVNRKGSSPPGTLNLDTVAQYSVPDGLTGLHRGVLSFMGGTECIVYSGIQGTLGVFIPFITREEFALFTQVESAIKRKVKNLLGAEYPSMSRIPAKGVVNGDLCTLVISNTPYIGPQDLEDIADTVDISSTGLVFKILSMRARLAI